MSLDVVIIAQGLVTPHSCDTRVMSCECRVAHAENIRKPPYGGFLIVREKSGYFVRLASASINARSSLSSERSSAFSLDN